MRILTTLMLAAVLTVPAVAQRRDSLSRDERAQLEERLSRLTQELRALEQRLGRSTVRGFSGNMSGNGEPFVWSVITGNRARLGVIVATGESDTDNLGARLEAVTANGPAAQAGLRAGDIIVRVNGQALADARPSPGERLIDAVDDLEDGDTVRVEYRRGTTTGRATIVARAMDGYSFGLGNQGFKLELDPLMGSVRGRGDASGVLNRALVEVREMPGLHSTFFTSGWSSMELTTLDTDLGSYFGATDGVLVVRAPSDSVLGLKSGDVIQRIGGRVPSSPSHALRILNSYDAGDEIRLDILRQRRQQTLTATVPARDMQRGPMIIRQRDER